MMSTLLNHDSNLFFPTGMINEDALARLIHALVGDVFDRQLYLDAHLRLPSDANPPMDLQAAPCCISPS